MIKLTVVEEKNGGGVDYVIIYSEAKTPEVSNEKGELKPIKPILMVEESVFERLMEEYTIIKGLNEE